MMVAGSIPEGPVFYPANFWQQPWVQNVLPFVTSVSVHLAILIIGLLVFGVYKAVSAPPHQDQVIIPESSMAQEGPPGGVPNVGLGDPLREAAQDKDPSSTDSAWADKKGPNVDLTSLAGAAGDSSDPVIETGPGGAFSKSGAKLNVGSGSGDAEGGAMAMFGAPGGGGMGPKGPVFGDGGNARVITFVCDASGSMLSKMDALKVEMSKVVHQLKPIQSFNVIFFQQGDPKSLDRSSVVTANPENKRKFDEFVKNINTAGDTNPIPGLEIAFKQKPQLVYLLTDGEFPDNKAVIAKIAELNKDKRIKVNTIAFTNSEDKKNKIDTAFKKVLQQIASENGGTFRDVNADDL